MARHAGWSGVPFYLTHQWRFIWPPYTQAMVPPDFTTFCDPGAETRLLPAVPRTAAAAAAAAGCAAPCVGKTVEASVIKLTGKVSVLECRQATTDMITDGLIVTLSKRRRVSPEAIIFIAGALCGAAAASLVFWLV